MKTVKFLLGACGVFLMIVGVLCIISGNLSTMLDSLPLCKCKRNREFQDYADVM